MKQIALKRGGLLRTDYADALIQEEAVTINLGNFSDGRSGHSYNCVADAKGVSRKVGSELMILRIAHIQSTISADVANFHDW